jgi:predicted metal-dependent phosphotriesterase family hydrolase
VQPSEELRRERKAFNPDGYLFITRNVLPRLLELGATQADVDAIMVDNPRNFFTD